MKDELTIPTADQALSCFIACQTLTAMYLPIFLIRLDERTDEVYVLAGEETEILIDRSGIRRLL
ncbi:hypothetical protein [Chroococcidiopsis sp. CCMEE 29]|uniref:DUF6888 family protein n=1 Tax=Chroococcidiopsis sp. CCMEE 29 TaxID=155894 RepID=UPI0020222A3A|nr:hypothetical protein [Chroococcidiopsis sp. CCMEE 29]